MEQHAIHIAANTVVNWLSLFQLIGISVLILILFLGGVLSLLEKTESCGKNHLFNELIMEEVETVLDNIAREQIKEELERKIQVNIEAGKWNKCLNVAEDLIEKGPTCQTQGKNNHNLYF